jgi:hypothetical protein
MAEEIKVGDTASAALPSCPCCTAERPLKATVDWSKGIVA